MGRGPVIVLDTHAWIWWVSEPRRLGRRGRAAIEATDRIGIPAICCFEVAAAAARGRILLDRAPLDWIDQALAEPRVQLLPLTPAVSVKATQLGAFHGDPADRLIVATALVEGATLVSKDRNIRDYPGAVTLW
jgi:PIN domain nuclease of toxin-antitoxin system